MRLNDLLEAAPPCRCGSPLQAVLGVEGRFEDIWSYPDLVLPPRVVEDALAAALGPGQKWRITASLDRVLVEINHEAGPVAKAAITNLFTGKQAPSIEIAPLQMPVGPKRRRVRWDGEGVGLLPGLCAEPRHNDRTVMRFPKPPMRREPGRGVGLPERP